MSAAKALVRYNKKGVAHAPFEKMDVCINLGKYVRELDRRTRNIIY